MAVLYRVGDRVRVNRPDHKHHNREMVIDQVYPGDHGNSYLAYSSGTEVFWGWESQFILVQFASAPATVNSSRKHKQQRTHSRPRVIRHAKAVHRIPRKRPGERLSYHR